MQDMLILRKATKDDCVFLYELRNEKEVRQNSFCTEEIGFQEHRTWFEKKMQDRNTCIYILEYGEDRIGQVRVDIAGEEAEISYALCKSARGHGYSKWMLKEAQKNVMEVFGKKKFIADVKEDNIASRKVFQSLNYIEKQTEYGYSYSFSI